MAIKQLSDGNPLGTTFGQSSTDLISFHGVATTSRRAAAALTASASIFVFTGASMSAGTPFGQIVDALAEIRTLLVAYGLHKGGA